MLKLTEHHPYNNALKHSTSPYLLQHAHNPVFWYPWNEEVLEMVRRENRPVLVSIGYSTCYWCHVMEREVFENASIAATMNRVLINIKIDREEMPELDEYYMTARQILTGQGGWPNNVFLTPDLKPFFACGTMGATESNGRPPFQHVVEWVENVWNTDRANVQRSADEISGVLRNLLEHPAQPERATAEEVVQRTAPLAMKLAEVLSEKHDAVNGGFFHAPKFPNEPYLQFLLGWYEAKQDARALNVLRTSLYKMAAGGLYDHVGCGFHRYAVDSSWFVPHFEKMLYNQAMLADVYTRYHALTGDAYCGHIAKSVFDFASGPFTAPQGAFYAAIDAETDGVEGEYYAWTAAEIESVLGPDDTRFFAGVYALAEIPHFPGHKHPDGEVVIARKPLPEIAEAVRMPYDVLMAKSAEIFNKLLNVRNQRKAPRLDNKIITAWNGLMIHALARASDALNRPEYAARAEAAAEFITSECFISQGGLKRIWVVKDAQQDASLEDYAYLIQGLVTLGRVRREPRWLSLAVELLQECERLFADEKGGYYLAPMNAGLPLRIRHAEDSALPSANGVMMHALLDLYQVSNEPFYLDRAVKLAAAFLPFMLKKEAGALLEYVTLLHACVRLQQIADVKADDKPIMPVFAPVKLSAQFSPPDPGPGSICSLFIRIHIEPGWYIYAKDTQENTLPTQLHIHGPGLEELIRVDWPEPAGRTFSPGETLRIYAESLTVHAVVKLKNTYTPGALSLDMRYQPCQEQLCQKPEELYLSL